MSTAVIAAVVGALIAQLGTLAIAFVTVRLALGRFQREKWWEKKYEAYAEALQTLHTLKRTFSALSRTASQVSGDMPDDAVERSIESVKALKFMYTGAMDDLRRTLDLADLFWSRESYEILNGLLDDLQEGLDDVDDESSFGKSSSHFGRALGLLKAAAKRDLIEN